MAIPVIKKGDTSAAIPIKLADGYEYVGATLAVGYQGVTRTFGDLAAGGTVYLSFTAAETAAFRLGTHNLVLVLRLADGSIRTVVADDAKIKVSDAPSEVYTPMITVDPAQTVGALTDADGLGEVKDVVNALARIVGAAASCIVIACAGASTVNDMPGTNLIYTAAETDALIAGAPYVRRDMPQYSIQEIGGQLAPSNGVWLPMGWSWLSARNGSIRAQTLFEYISTNPWGFSRGGGSLEPATNYTDRATNEVLHSAVAAITNGHEEVSAWQVYVNGNARPDLSAHDYSVDTVPDGTLWELRISFEGDVDSGLRVASSLVPDGETLEWQDDITRTVGYEEFYDDISEGDVVRVLRTRKWRSAYGFAMTNDLQDISAGVSEETSTNIAEAVVREKSLGGIWDRDLEVWWTPVMVNGALTYQATTNVDMNAEVTP